MGQSTDITPDNVDALLQEIDSSDEPNVPAKIPGAGLSGTREWADAQKLRERRATMDAALRQGASNDAIMALFTGPKFGLSEQQVVALKRDVRARWDDEDSEHQRYYRSAAIRRIQLAITAATKAGKWTAVANLEKVLSEVTGTAIQPLEASNGDERLNDAVLAVLGAKDAGQVRIMIERQRVMIESTPVGGGPVKRLVGPTTTRTIIEGGGGA